MLRVLIIDSSPLHRDSLRGMLDPSQYVVFEAEEGFTGFGIHKNQRANLIFLDTLLPEEVGAWSSMTTLQMLQHEDQFVSIIMTGTSDLKSGRVQGEAYDMGYRDFIRKPYDPSDVENLMQRLNR